MHDETLAELADAALASAGMDLDAAMPLLLEALDRAAEELRESLYATGCRHLLSARRTADRTRKLLGALPQIAAVTHEDDGASARLRTSIRSSLYGYAMSKVNARGNCFLGDSSREEVLAQAALYDQLADHNRARAGWMERIAALMPKKAGVVSDHVSVEMLASLLAKEELAEAA
jgi:hypothetical protein